GADIADFTESGGAQQRRLRVADEVRLSLFGRARPLVVPAHRHKDAPTGECGTPHRLFGHGFQTRVDHRFAQFGPPGRPQIPYGCVESPAWGPGVVESFTDDGHGVGWRNVV